VASPAQPCEESTIGESTLALALLAYRDIQKFVQSRQNQKFPNIIT
jgi:hypothetical protein